MCSIIGYHGTSSAASVLVDALRRMEYRGYDSVGIATLSGNGILVKKGVGKVAEVNNKLRLETLPGSVGIGHTRWATHGAVTDANAHPHLSSTEKIAVVHNGIIDNYLELKKDLQQKGFIFRSQTDSEVIANLLQEYFDQTGDIKQTIIRTVSKLKGSYAFIAMFEDGTFAAARFHEPVVIGIGKEDYFISSDVLGFIKYADDFGFIQYVDDVIYMNDGEFAIVKSFGIELYDFNGAPVKHQIVKVSKEFATVDKGEYAHFTLKEICEQPFTILAGKNFDIPIVSKDDGLDGITPDIVDLPDSDDNFLDPVDLPDSDDTFFDPPTGRPGYAKAKLNSVAKIIKQCKNAYVTGSGTSYNASLVGQYLFSKYAKIKLEPIIASEARFYPHNFDDRTVLIAVSQSGESADVLETVNIAKNAGSKIISIVNVMTSSLVRQSHISVGLNCGPEIGVAATKSFTSQLAIFYKIVDKLCEGYIRLNLNEISENMTEMLSNQDNVKDVARKLAGVSDIYVLGRGIHYPIACEAALKIKELSYIHAEAVLGGELKHGPLALISHGVYVIIINPNDATYVDTLASANEIKARGAKIIGISDKPSEIYDHWIQIPAIREPLFPLIEIIPLQLLAYYTAVERDANPDYPRNLAKSVTVK